MRNTPQQGEVYRHFKGNIYEVINVAMHTETGESLVIYQDRSDNSKVFARPLNMFLSEVDREKYPDIKEKYRFTLVNETDDGKENSINEAGNKINPLLEELLDADSYEDKLDIFTKMRDIQDKTMLINVAVSLDIEITKDEVDEIYDEILYCLRMMAKYECNRLRK